MVGSIVREDQKKRVPGELVTTVIKHCLYGGSGEEEHRLSNRHAGDKVGETSTQRVQEEAFDRVVVERTVCIRNVETMVTGVEGC